MTEKRITTKKLFIFTDGGALNNPGPAAAGVVVKNEKGKVLTRFGKFIGHTTNNVAEYMGAIEALKWLKKNKEVEKWEVGNVSGNGDGKWGRKKAKHSPSLLPAERDPASRDTSRPTSHLAPPAEPLATHGSPSPQIHFYLDSRLVVNQLNGLFKIKNAKLRELAFQVRQLEQQVGGNIIYHFIPREKNHLADEEVKKVLAKKRRRQA